MLFGSWLSSFARPISILRLSCKLRAPRRRLTYFPVAVERSESRLVLSAPNITQLNAPTSVDEGASSEGSVSVTFDCDDEDTLNHVRWSSDGGTTWTVEEDVYVSGTVTSMFGIDTSDQGTRSWLVEIIDSEGLTTSASGSITVNNVAPTLTLTSSPDGGTVSEHQSVCIAGIAFDPAGVNDPLTLTVSWGAGPNATEVINLDPNGDGSFMLSHDYALDSDSDQVITISITVEDDDGESDTESIALNYDDVISDLLAEGVGRVDGLLHFLMHSIVEAGSAGRGIASYSVDINHDGTWDVSLEIDSETWDPENVGLLDSADVSWLGSPTGTSSFTGRFMVTTTDGIFDCDDFPIDVFAAVGTTTYGVESPGLGATTNAIDADTSVVYDSVDEQTIFRITGTAEPIPKKKDASASGSIGLTKADLAGAYNTRTYALNTGVKFRATVNSSEPLASMPYFIQYVTATQYSTDPSTGQQSSTQVFGGLDGPSNADPDHPNRYTVQNTVTGYSEMDDHPSWGLPLEKIQMRWNVSGTKLYFRMLHTVADEIATNSEHFRRVLCQEYVEWSFQTYVVQHDNTGYTPIGYINWKFRVRATVAGYSIEWVTAPTFNTGSDPNSWNL